MVINWFYVQGFEPSATAINNFISLNARSNKPGGITVVKGRLPHQEATFTNQEIVAIEDANRTKYNTANK
jgi:hypothetical protein